MDSSSGNSMPELKDFSVETSWIPNTPVKPGSPPLQPICKTREENQADWLQLQIGSQEYFKGKMVLLQSKDDHRLDDAEKMSKMSFSSLLALANAASGSGAAANATAQAAFSALCFSQVSGGSSMCSKIPLNLSSPPRMEDATSCSNSSFQFSPLTPDQTKLNYGGQVSDVLNQNINDTQTPIPGDVQEKSKENELQQQKGLSELANVLSDSLENHKPDNGDSLGTEMNKTPQQKPRRKKHRPKVVTEGKPRRPYKPRTPKNSGLEKAQTGKRKYVRRKEGNNPVIVPLDNSSNDINPETKLPSSNETPTSTRKNAQGSVKKPAVTLSDEGSNAIDPETKSPGSNETQKIKRNSVQRKRVNKSAVTPSDEGSNAIDPDTKSPGSNETPKSKRKTVRRKGVNKSVVAPSDEVSNVTDPERKSHGSNETPKRKRKRVQRNEAKKSPIENGSCGTIGQKTVCRPRRTCRRDLSCQFEEQVTDDNSTQSSSNIDGPDVQKFCTPDQSLLTMQLGQHKVANAEQPERQTPEASTPSKTDSDVQIFCSPDQSMSTVQLGQLTGANLELPEVRTAYSQPERQTPEPSTPSKTDSICENKPMYGNTMGKYKSFFSNGAYDREKNLLDMIGNTSALQETRNANSSNCSSHTLLTQEKQGKGFKRQQPCPAKEVQLFSTIAGQNRYNSLQAYQAVIPLKRYDINRTSGMHFPTVGNKRIGKEHIAISCTEHFRAKPDYMIAKSQWDARGFITNNIASNAAQNLQQLRYLPKFVDSGELKRKRSAGVTQVCDLTSLHETCKEGTTPIREVTSGFGQTFSHLHHTAIKDLAADSFPIITKKQSKRNKFNGAEAPNICAQHQFIRTSNGAGPLLAPTWSVLSLVDEIVERFNHLNLKETNAIVLYQGNGAIVPFGGAFGRIRKKRPRAKVELDDETNKVWMLLMQDINSEGIDGTDEAKAKWWEGERRVFHGRVESFIARMRLVQGDRRFSPWKGSVVDSVVGVFLTQNVSDHLSSSAFMSLAAKFPLKSNSSVKLHEERTSIIIEEPESDQAEPDEVLSSQNYVDSLLTQTVERTGSSSLCSSSALTGTSISHSVYRLESQNSTANMNGPNQIKHGEPSMQFEDKQESKGTSVEQRPNFFVPREKDDKLLGNFGEHCAHEQSGSSVESSNQVTNQRNITDENSMCCNNHHIEVTKIDDGSVTNIETRMGIEESKSNLKGEQEVSASSGIQDITEQISTAADSLNEFMKSNLDGHNNHSGNIVDRTNTSHSDAKGGKPGKGEQNEVHWDSLRQQAQANGKKREITADTMDSLDWEAVRLADVGKIADSIKERGMNNRLADRIQNFLNRLVTEHGSTNLEWLRDVPPDKAKEFLLSFKGLGLKSVECVRLLTLHHLAFPVDTNVGRIAVRLGWVPLQPLPESLQLHLLEMYPILESIQKYLWPRLCKLDQETLYELHYHMITFGKVFCTKSKPNCNACPLRAECRHFASAFASARLALPAAEEKGIVSVMENKAAEQNPIRTTNPLQLHLPQTDQESVAHSGVSYSQPIIEEPATPEPFVEVPTTPEVENIPQEIDIEDAYGDDPDDIPRIDLNMTQFAQNLKMFVENNMELTQAEMSKALIALTPQAASIPRPKLKHISRLRTEHYVYELPDSHPLLKELDKREPDDPCSYLLAIWTPGETANSVQPPERQCSSQESGKVCNNETCSACNCIQETHSLTVRGTLLIPCRTAMRGRFPLNGTYFQVNEVFADHESSLKPIDVPRNWLWNLPRKTVFFGTSIPTIFRGLSTREIQYCFREGYVCVRGFDQKTRAPRPLIARLHLPASKLNKTTKGKADDTQHKHSQ